MCAALLLNTLPPAHADQAYRVRTGDNDITLVSWSCLGRGSVRVVLHCGLTTTARHSSSCTGAHCCGFAVCSPRRTAGCVQLAVRSWLCAPLSLGVICAPLQPVPSALASSTGISSFDDALLRLALSHLCLRGCALVLAPVAVLAAARLAAPGRGSPRVQGSTLCCPALAKRCCDECCARRGCHRPSAALLHLAAPGWLDPCMIEESRRVCTGPPAS